jgi:type VI protein secretion system component Hcp
MTAARVATAFALSLLIAAASFAQNPDAPDPPRMDWGVLQGLTPSGTASDNLLGGSLMEGQTRGYLQIDEIAGPETDPAFDGWIPIVDWHYELTWIPVNSGTQDEEQWGSQIKLGPITVLKLVDQSTPQLIARAGEGEPIAEVGLQVTTRPDPNTVARIFGVRMTDVRITSIRRIGTSRFGPGLEELTLRFEEAIFDYMVYDDQNAKEGEWETRVRRYR